MGFFGDLSMFLDRLVYALTESSGFLDALSNVFSTFADAAETSLLLLVFLVSIVSAVVSFITTAIYWILESLPVFILANKAHRKSAWLAFVPIFPAFFRLYVLSDIAGNKPAFLQGKLAVKSRKDSFWIYVGVSLLGPTVMATIVGVLSVIPIIGQIAIVLIFVPTIICTLIEYIYLRDVIEVFKGPESSCTVLAAVVTALDAFITFGLARIIFLYSLLGCKPVVPANRVIDVEYR